VKGYEDVPYVAEDDLWQEPSPSLGHGIDADEDEDAIPDEPE
jgi:hypothetical protein